MGSEQARFIAKYIACSCVGKKEGEQSHWHSYHVVEKGGCYGSGLRGKSGIQHESRPFRGFHLSPLVLLDLVELLVRFEDEEKDREGGSQMAHPQ